MEFDQRSREERDYPCSDYYSTGGPYRPPRRPKNYGWMVAVLGVFLLCVAGSTVLSRQEEQAAETPQPAETAAAETTALETEIPDDETEPDEEETAPVSQAGVIGSGTELVIAGEEDETLSLQEVYKKIIPSVVSITASYAGGKSTGTGIIMSQDGYIITNYHVVSNAKQVTVLLSDDTEYVAARVGGDETSDLMVLKIDAEGLTPAEFCDSDTVEVGDEVVAIGDPLGTQFRGTMTDGIICGINRDVHVGDRTMTLLQTNAALNSGNSGGPLVNMSGQVIGVNTMKISSEDYTLVEGLGFAIPISSAKAIVDELVEKGYVSGRPAFGFTVETLDSPVVLFYNLPGKLYIRQVMEGSDAYEQGIRAGDIITAIDGIAVSTMDEFNSVKNEYAAGDTVRLTIYHQNTEMEVEVQLMDRADFD